MLRFGLASDGVYMCPVCCHPGGSLLHCPSTLTGTRPAVHFCCTVLGVASTGCYPASCPVKPGLSSCISSRNGRLRPRPFILLRILQYRLRRPHCTSYSTGRILSSSFFDSAMESPGSESYPLSRNAEPSPVPHYTSKQLPPMNSRSRELFGIVSGAIGTKYVRNLRSRFASG